MTISTEVRIHTRDAQGVSETIPVLVTPADFGAAVDLPTAAHIEALSAALFGSAGTNGPSTQIVTGYEVAVIENAPTNIGNRNGVVATPIALKTRQGVGISGNVGLLGPEGIELRIPGYDKSIAPLTINDRNAVTMSAAVFTAIRTALVNLGYQDPAGLVWTSSQILESGVIFNGRRAPVKPR
jgi:hypothetical protein